MERVHTVGTPQHQYESSDGVHMSTLSNCCLLDVSVGYLEYVVAVVHLCNLSVHIGMTVLSRSVK